MNFTSTMDGTVCVLRLAGDCEGGHDLMRLEREVSKQLDQGVRRFVLDLADVTYVLGDGLDAVTGTFESITKAGGRLAMSNGNFLEGTLERLEYGDALPRFETLREAVAALAT